MIFSSSTDVYASLGSTASGILGDFKAYIFVIAGIVLAFYVIQRLVSAIFPQRYYGDNQTKDI
jgi:hypothetical protein